MDDKITIIEGPPPAFETVQEGWVLGLNESPHLSNVAVTRLRTFNGPALIERCHRTWHNQSTMHLEFRGMDGLENTAPILAARTLDVDEGHMLLLWVRLESEEVELEAGIDDDFGDDLDDDPGFSDY